MEQNLYPYTLYRQNMANLALYWFNFFQSYGRGSNPQPLYLVMKLYFIWNQGVFVVLFQLFSFTSTSHCVGTTTEFSMNWISSFFIVNKGFKLLLDDIHEKNEKNQLICPKNNIYSSHVWSLSSKGSNFFDQEVYTQYTAILEVVWIYDHC